MSKTIAALSIESQLIFQDFEKLAVGEERTYEYIANLVGISKVDATYGPLRTARNKMQSEFGIVIDPIGGYGVRRLNDQEILAKSRGRIRKNKNNSRRGRKEIGCIELTGLTDSQKVEVNVVATIHAAVETMASAKAVKAIEQKVSKDNSALTITQTLAAFTGNTEKEKKTTKE